MANIRKRGNTYQIRVSVGYDKSGKQVTRTKSWKPNPNMTAREIKSELQKQACKFEEQCLRGFVYTDVKFEDFAEKWFSEFAAINLKRSSLQRMRACTIRVYAVFGHFRIDKISHGQIQAFIDDLAQNGRHLKQKDVPLSRKSVIHHLSFLSDVFAYAMRLELLETNPCTNIYVPKGEKKEKEVYTLDEVRRLFALMDEDAPLKYRVFVTLAVYSGFRRGELMGLEWKDVDWEHNVISIRRTSNYTVKDGRYTDTVKTKHSLRSLKLPNYVFAVLKELYDDQQRQKSELGDKWVDSDRVFISDFGDPLFCTMPYKWLKKFTAQHGMRFCDIHSLRHFNATSLIYSGIDAATVSAALGHSAVSTTTSVYCHAFQEMQARTGEAISTVLDLDHNPYSGKKAV